MSYSEAKYFMYLDLLKKKDQLQSSLEEEDINQSKVLNEIKLIDQVFNEGNSIIEDPLVAKWEKEFEEGQDLDLDEME